MSLRSPPFPPAFLFTDPRSHHIFSMPPEVLRGKQYTYSVDYWSLGCILFEFLYVLSALVLSSAFFYALNLIWLLFLLSAIRSAGYPPFSGATPDETWANLKNWNTVLTRPVYTNPKDLIFNMGDEAWDAITRFVPL